MQLVIGSVLNDHTPNSYEVIIKTMIGDADGYLDVKVGPFIKGEDEAAITYLIETLDRLDKAFPDGRWGGTDYDNVEGFIPWFNSGNYTEVQYADYCRKSPLTYEQHLEAVKLVGKRSVYWPSDPQQDNGDPTSYESFKIFYYDEHTVKHSVTVEA